MKLYAPSLTPHSHKISTDVNDATEDTAIRQKAEKKTQQQMKKNPSAKKPIFDIEF